jgi:ribosomal protein L37AE/L43A
MSSLHEIRRYVEEHYADHRLCPHCGSSGQTHRFLFRVYRCANSICSASLNTFKLRPLRRRQVG